MPTRVLHLIDLRDSADEARAACQAARRISAASHRVIGLGTAADAARARSAGLSVDAFAPHIGPWPELSGRRMKRVISDRDGRGAGRPWADVVQCWSPYLLGVARLASGQRTPPRVCALLRPPLQPPSGFERARLAFGFRFATTFAFDRFVRSSWAELVSARRGGTLLEQDTRLLSPPLHNPTDAPRREAARAALGLQPSDIAVGLLADPPSAADAASFAFVLGLLFTTGARVVGVIRAGAMHQRRGIRFVRSHGRRWGLVVVRDGAAAPYAAFDACDVAVWMGGEPAGKGHVGAATGPLSIVAALARGIPVVAAMHPISQSALRGHPQPHAHDERGPLADALLARDQSLNALADRLLPLVHDTEFRLRVSALARRWASAPTWGQTFDEDLPRLWHEVTNAPVQRPGLPTPLALLEGAA